MTMKTIISNNNHHHDNGDDDDDDRHDVGGVSAQLPDRKKLRSHLPVLSIALFCICLHFATQMSFATKQTVLLFLVLSITFFATFVLFAKQKKCIAVCQF